MKNKFKVTDNSGDRSYFTIVPNYVVNHSTPYEQAIYLYMKRVAGETGTCWMSAKTIAEKLGCSRNTISKYRNKLVERGWIELVGKAGKTKPTDEYRIVDLWNLNYKTYCRKESSTVEQSKKESSTDKKKVQQVNLESSPVVHKEEPINKINKKEQVVIPSSINPYSWNEWLDYRKEIKKRMTGMTINRQVKLLCKYSKDQQKEIIDKSIQNGWSGLFEPKESKKSHGITV